MGGVPNFDGWFCNFPWKLQRFFGIFPVLATSISHIVDAIFRYTSLHSTVTSSSHGHKIAATKINPSLVPLYPRDIFIKFVCHPLYIQLCPGYIPISCYISHLSPLYISTSIFDFYTPVILGVYPRFQTHPRPKLCQVCRQREFDLSRRQTELTMTRGCSRGRYHRSIIPLGYLIGGLEHKFYDFPIILGISSSQLTNSLHHF